MQPDTKPTLVLPSANANANVEDEDESSPAIETTAIEDFQVNLDAFNPYIIHAPHEPCAMAMVNRRPSGGVYYKDTNCPQDVAWLAGLGWAKGRVFMCVSPLV